MPDVPEFVRTACQGGKNAPKSVQMQIQNTMQEWVAEQLRERLEAHSLSHLKVDPKRKSYAGGWRSVAVNVHIQSEELGLVLAVEPKHLQSNVSASKNWKNMLNDLVAFAGNIHSRFPMCVVGGVLGLSHDVGNKVLEEMYSIVNKVAIRQTSIEPNNLLEGFGIIVYECSSPRISPAAPPPNSPYRINIMLDHMVEMLHQRYVK